MNHDEEENLDDDLENGHRMNPNEDSVKRPEEKPEDFGLDDEDPDNRYH